MSPDRPWMLALGCLCLWLPFGIYATSASEDSLVHFFPDDAFYYLQPAVNFVRLGFPTFDGVHLTNGYHPLNFLFVSVLASFLDRIALLRATFALDMALIVGALAWIVWQRAGSLSCSGQLALLSALTLPVLTGFLILSSGMESALLVLCVAWLLASWETAQNRQVTLRRNLVVGLAFGVTVLTRLDMAIALLPFIMLLSLAAVHHLRAHRMYELAQLLWIGVVPGALLAAYLGANFAYTGHVLPISGYVKQLWIGSANSWGPSTRGEAIGWAITLLPALASAIAVIRAVRSGETRSTVLLLNVGNLLFYAYLTMGVAQVFRWYYAFPLTCLVINIADLAASVRSINPLAASGNRGPFVALAGVTLSVLANGLFLPWAGNRESSTSYQLKEVSALVNQYGGAHAVTGAQDAGVIGYFATGRVINLDGLANDFDYVDNYLHRQRVAKYMRRETVTHLLVRDGMLLNADEVAADTYTEARSALDPELVLKRENELFRYQLPGQFTVYYFRLDR